MVMYTHKIFIFRYTLYIKARQAGFINKFTHQFKAIRGCWLHGNAYIHVDDVMKLTYVKRQNFSFTEHFLSD